MKITLAKDWVDANGKPHKADRTIQVEAATGRDLILRGLARATEADPKAAATAGQADENPEG